eukprot:1380647-Pyramimonas_sp.AAC.1
MRETGWRPKVAMHESVPKVPLNCPRGSKSGSKVSLKGPNAALHVMKETEKVHPLFGARSGRARPARVPQRNPWVRVGQRRALCGPRTTHYGVHRATNVGPDERAEDLQKRAMQQRVPLGCKKG